MSFIDIGKSRIRSSATDEASDGRVEARGAAGRNLGRLQVGGLVASKRSGHGV